MVWKTGDDRVHNLQLRIWKRWNGTMNWLVWLKPMLMNAHLPMIVPIVGEWNGLGWAKTCTFTSRRRKVRPLIGREPSRIGMMR